MALFFKPYRALAKFKKFVVVFNSLYFQTLFSVKIFFSVERVFSVKIIFLQEENLPPPISDLFFYLIS